MIDTKYNEDDLAFLIRIDDGSLKAMEKKGWIAYLGLPQLTFKNRSKRPTNATNLQHTKSTTATISPLIKAEGLYVVPNQTETLTRKR